MSLSPTSLHVLPLQGSDQWYKVVLSQHVGNEDIKHIFIVLSGFLIVFEILLFYFRLLSIGFKDDKLKLVVTTLSLKVTVSPNSFYVVLNSMTIFF